MTLYILIFLISFAVLAWKRLDWALMFLLAALPAYVVRFKVFGVPSTLLEGMILISFVVWFFKNTHFKDFVLGRYKIKAFLDNSPFKKGGSQEGRIKYPFGVEIILMLIISLAAAGVSGFSLDSLGIWKAYFFEPALLYILILNVFNITSPHLTSPCKGEGQNMTSPNLSLLRRGIMREASPNSFQFSGIKEDDKMRPHLTSPYKGEGQYTNSLSKGEGQNATSPNLSLLAPQSDCVRGLRRGTDNGVERIILSLAIGALAVSVYSILQKITGLGIDNVLWQAEETRRVVSFFGYPNAVGLYLAPIVMILFGVFCYSNSREFRDEQGCVGKKDLSGREKSVLSNDNKICLAENPPRLAGQPTPPEYGHPSQEGNRPPLQVGELPTVLIEGDKSWHGFFIWPLKRESISSIGLSKGFLLAIIFISLLAIYYARSEGALVGLMAGLIIFGLLAGKKSRLSTLVVLVFFAGGIAFYQPVRSFFVKKITLRDFSGQVRVAQWKETWQMLKNGKIIQGAGLANYQKAIEPYHIPGIFYDDGTDKEFHRHVVWNDEYKKKVWRPVEIYLYPHNILLNFWSELGLVGLLLFIWIILKFSVLLIKNYFNPEYSGQNSKFLLLGLLGAIIIIVVHGLVDVPYFKNDLACLFWILIAISVLLSFRQKK